MATPLQSPSKQMLVVPADPRGLRRVLGKKFLVFLPALAVLPALWLVVRQPGDTSEKVFLSFGAPALLFLGTFGFFGWLLTRHPELRFELDAGRFRVDGLEIDYPVDASSPVIQLSPKGKAWNFLREGTVVHQVHREAFPDLPEKVSAWLSGVPIPPMATEPSAPPPTLLRILGNSFRDLVSPDAVLLARRIPSQAGGSPWMERSTALWNLAWWIAIPTLAWAFVFAWAVPDDIHPGNVGSVLALVLLLPGIQMVSGWISGSFVAGFCRWSNRKFGPGDAS